MSVTVELLYGTRGRRERKREWQSISDIVKHHICAGGGHKDVYWKLLKMGVGGKEEGEHWKGLNGLKWSVRTVGMHQETPLNIHLNINNERQDCEIGTVWGALDGERGWKEMEVREHAGWTSYNYMK
jgi:hypothetical protein